MSAQKLAAKVQPGSNVRWDRLENAAFAAHPSVLAPGGAANGGTRFGKSYWNLIWGIPVVLVYLFCYTAPVWGAAAISVSRFQTYQQDPEQRIPLSGIMFIFVLALLLVNFVRWVVKGRKASGFYEIQAVLAVVLGGLSAIAVRMYGLRDSVSSWQVWIVPVLAATIIGAIFLIFLVGARVAQRSRQSSSNASAETLPRNKLELLKQRRESVEQLSDDDRAAIRRDLDAAITDLTTRGLISDSEAERARGTELGGLALRMPRR
jgi:hypothetical protein